MSESPSACSRRGVVWAPGEVLGVARGQTSRLNLTRLEAGSGGAASQVGLPEDEGGTGGGSGSDGGGGDGGGRQPSTRVELHLVLPSTGP